MTAPAPEPAVHVARSFDEVPARTMYAISRLRQEVFCVEQDCVYLDLDGRDLEPGAMQLWIEAEDGRAEASEGAAPGAAGSGSGIAATVRVLPEDAQEPGLRSIGRVATDPAYRGRGLAARLVRAAIDECAGAPILIHAQSYLTEWYGRFGFATCGPEFLEDGIPHTPMRLG